MTRFILMGLWSLISTICFAICLAIGFSIGKSIIARFFPSLVTL